MNGQSMDRGEARVARLWIRGLALFQLAQLTQELKSSPHISYASLPFETRPQWLAWSWWLGLDDIYVGVSRVQYVCHVRLYNFLKFLDAFSAHNDGLSVYAHVWKKKKLCIFCLKSCRMCVSLDSKDLLV